VPARGRGGTPKEGTLLAAAKFVAEYAMPMAERTYGDAACTELDRSTATLARWIAKQRPLPEAIHVREMQREVRLPALSLPLPFTPPARR